MGCNNIRKQERKDYGWLEIERVMAEYRLTRSGKLGIKWQGLLIVEKRNIIQGSGEEK